MSKNWSKKIVNSRKKVSTNKKGSKGGVGYYDFFFYKILCGKFWWN